MSPELAGARRLANSQQRAGKRGSNPRPHFSRDTKQLKQTDGDGLKDTHGWQGEEGDSQQSEACGQQPARPGLGGLVSVADGRQGDLQGSEFNTQELNPPGTAFTSLLYLWFSSVLVRVDLTGRLPS